MNKLLILSFLIFWNLSLAKDIDLNWDVAAAGNFKFLSPEISNDQSNVQLGIVSQWLNDGGEKLFLNSLAKLDTGSGIITSNEYIFFIKQNESQVVILGGEELSRQNVDKARQLLDELGPPGPGLTIPRHGFQAYTISQSWCWHPRFGMYSKQDSIAEHIWHDQLRWLFKLSGNPRAHWDTWFWHYDSSDWLWTGIGIYPWLFSTTNGWLYLLESDSKNSKWTYSVNESKWIKISESTEDFLGPN